jgi:hypothetical protein
MFMERIRRLAMDWGKSPQALDGVARESLFYGMRLETKPGRLKQELKRVGIDSKLATPLWSGNYYLLLTLPEILIKKNSKIPCLEDYLFAKKTLKRPHLSVLRKRFKNIPNASREDMIQKLLRTIKRESYRGRYLTQFDRMYEKKADIHHDLICEALAVMNKEWTNFKNHNQVEMLNYLSYCVGTKADTYLSATTPKMKRAHLEDPSELEALINAQKEDDLNWDNTPASHMLQQDLQQMLSKEAYLGVALLMDFAEPEQKNKFEKSLKERGFNRQQLSHSKLKLLIERYLGVKVFQNLRNSEELSQYLRS